MTDATVLAVPGEVTGVSLQLPEGLEFGAWVQVGCQLGRMEAAYRWWVGDWLNYGERTYGSTYTREMDVTGLEYSSLANCRWVAKSVGFSRRRENLTWSHHLEVAKLTAEDQELWLQKAEANAWTAKELRAFLKGSKSKALPMHTPLLRFCQDLPTPVIVAQILRVYFPDATTAFDATGGDGGFWDGSEPVEVTALYVDPSRVDGAAGDFRKLDEDDASYDVVLFDPPHLADSSAGAIMAARYGTVPDDEIADVVRDGCCEAWRVARLGVIVKVTDHVHGQQYVRESDWVVQAIGQSPYDEVYQVREHATIDPKWQEQLSAYNNGATYLIFRKDGPLHKRRGVT